MALFMRSTGATFDQSYIADASKVTWDNDPAPVWQNKNAVVTLLTKLNNVPINQAQTLLNSILQTYDENSNNPDDLRSKFRNATDTAVTQILSR